MSSNDHNYVMSSATAEAVGGLLVCGDTNEVQPTQLAICGQIQGVSGAASTKREALQDQVTTLCYENRACKKAKKKGTTLACIFLLCVPSDQLYICSYAVFTGLLFQWCESTAAITRVSDEYLVPYCTMERRQDGLPANRVRNRRQRGRNPPWLCDG